VILTLGSVKVFRRIGLDQPVIFDLRLIKKGPLINLPIAFDLRIVEMFDEFA
jgi:hypothetical protein